MAATASSSTARRAERRASVGSLRSNRPKAPEIRESPCSASLPLTTTRIRASAIGLLQGEDGTVSPEALLQAPEIGGVARLPRLNRANQGELPMRGGLHPQGKGHKGHRHVGELSPVGKILAPETVPVGSGVGGLRTVAPVFPQKKPGTSASTSPGEM